MSNKKPNLKFDKLNITNDTKQKIKELNFKYMTPVQGSVIPLFLTNKDVCVEAVTGSGKTLAFVIPVIEIMKKKINKNNWKKNFVGSLIISPTRELAMQIYDVVSHFCNHSNSNNDDENNNNNNENNILLSCQLLVGGTSIDENINEFKENGATIIIGTPGRIGDLLCRHDSIYNLKMLEVLILDEADTLLDMGFYNIINNILNILPKQRRTGLFSATQTKEVKELARAGLRNPVTISVQVKNNGNDSNNFQATPTSLKNFYFKLDENISETKLYLLINFLHKYGKNNKIIVFMLTCACIDYFTRLFKKLPIFKDNDISIFGFHGKMVQKKRNGIYKRFISLPSGILLCTDVAARGVDIPNIDWIIQFDPPQDPSFFIHRVGRTARAGRSGKALTFLLPHEIDYIHYLNVKKVPIYPIEEWGVQKDDDDDDDDDDDGDGDDIDIDNDNDNNNNKNNNNEKNNEEEKENNNNDNNKIINNNNNINYVNFNEIKEKTKILLEEIKNMILLDRDLLEKGTRAFISFIRAYKEHHLQFIFDFNRLDIGSVAREFSLFQLPNMRELRTIKTSFVPDPNIDVGAIPFSNPEREKARQLRTEKMKKEREKEKLEKFKKKKKKEKIILKQQEQKRKRKGKNSKILEEWDDLAYEERLYKKMRKGKISEDELNELLSDEEDYNINEHDKIFQNNNENDFNVKKKKRKLNDDINHFSSKKINKKKNRVRIRNQNRHKNNIKRKKNR